MQKQNQADVYITHICKAPTYMRAKYRPPPLTIVTTPKIAKHRRHAAAYGRWIRLVGHACATGVRRGLGSGATMNDLSADARRACVCRPAACMHVPLCRVHDSRPRKQAAQRYRTVPVHVRDMVCESKGEGLGLRSCVCGDWRVG